MTEYITDIVSIKIVIIMKKEIINKCSVLLYLLPYSFIVGPFLSELLILICNILIVYLIIKTKEFKFYFKNKFIILLLLVYFYLVVSSILSEHILFSLNSSLFYFRWILFVVSVHYLSVNNDNFLKILSLNFLVVFLIFLFDSHFQLLFGQNIMGYEIQVPHRISSFFYDELILGGFALKILPVLFFCFFSNKEIFNSQKLLFLFLIFSLFSTIIISGERSAIILFLLYLFLFFLINYKKFKKEIGVVFITILLSLGSIYLFSETYKNRIFINLLDSLKNNIQHNEIGRSKYKNFSIFSFVHEKHITSAYLIFRKSDLKKKLFGIGPKNFRHYCSIQRFCDYENCCSTHPHNIPAQVLSETGLIGLIILIYIYFLILNKLFKYFYAQITNKKDKIKIEEISIILGIFIVLFPLSTSGSLFHNKFNILLFTLVGFIHASNSLKKKGS